MPWSPASVAYGIRHSRLFGFLGRAGDAIDGVLALQGTGNVPRECFSKIGWPNQVTAMLVDDDEHYRLTFNVDGITLVIKLSEVQQLTQQNARDMFVDVVTAALPITNPGRKINRVGLVETYDLPRVTPGEVAASALTRLVDIGRPTDFGFRAAFRRPVVDGSDDGDWWNTILQVAAAKSDDDLDSPDILRVSIDCQHHFVPDVVFTANLVRSHYASFFEQAESLQQHQLAGLEELQPGLR